jgi:two-component system, chemotaxis family, CheB/CheR fusion protein
VVQAIGELPGDPGCASGEEAYSIAIVLLKYLGDRATSTRIQIFGTDLGQK